MFNEDRIVRLLGDVKRFAQEYKQLTGKPLGITGEVAEYEAARLLGVELAPARQPGYDAVETRDGKLRKLQIKGRCLPDDPKPGQRLGSIRTQHDWDAVLMVLLDQNFDDVRVRQRRRVADLVHGVLGDLAQNSAHDLAGTRLR